MGEGMGERLMFATQQRVTLKFPDRYQGKNGVLVWYDLDLRVGLVRLDDYDPPVEVHAGMTDILVTCVRCGEGIEHDAEAAEIKEGLCHADCMLLDDEIA
jgi:hypothetical protein